VETNEKAGDRKTAGKTAGEKGPRLSPAPTHFSRQFCFLDPLFLQSWSLEQASETLSTILSPIYFSGVSV